MTRSKWSHNSQTKNKKLYPWVLIFAVMVIAALGKFFLLAKEEGRLPIKVQAADGARAPAGGNAALGAGASGVVAAQAVRKVPVEKFLAEEADRIGFTVEDPQAAEAALVAYAEELLPVELEWLGGQALDVKIPQDQRFLAAYLVTLAKDPARVPVLQKIATAPLPAPNKKNPHGDMHYAYESAIRGLAIEGINGSDPASREARQVIMATAADDFTYDRAMRVDRSAAGEASPVDEQDRKGMAGLLYGTN